MGVIAVVLYLLCSADDAIAEKGGVYEKEREGEERNAGAITLGCALALATRRRYAERVQSGDVRAQPGGGRTVRAWKKHRTGLASGIWRRRGRYELGVPALELMLRYISLAARLI